MADGDKPCENCKKPIFKKNGTWRHRSYHTNNSIYCDMTPWHYQKATPPDD